MRETILFEKHAINGQSVITFWPKWQESEEKLWKMIFKIVKFKFKFRLKKLNTDLQHCIFNFPNDQSHESRIYNFVNPWIRIYICIKDSHPLENKTSEFSWTSIFLPSIYRIFAGYPTRWTWRAPADIELDSFRW